MSETEAGKPHTARPIRAGEQVFDELLAIRAGNGSRELIGIEDCVAKTVDALFKRVIGTAIGSSLTRIVVTITLIDVIVDTMSFQDILKRLDITVVDLVCFKVRVGIVFGGLSHGCCDFSGIAVEDEEFAMDSLDDLFEDLDGLDVAVKRDGYTATIAHQVSSSQFSGWSL